jgi:ribonuclease HII
MPVLKMKYYTEGYNRNKIEAGIDEAGRGCLAGPVVAAVVILPSQFPDDTYLQIKDSKKLSEKKREMLYDYITKHVSDYAIASSTPEEIDKYNILQATFNTMHKAIHKLAFIPELLLVDGNGFRPFCTNKDNNNDDDDEDTYVEHRCIKGGDNEYLAIAAASILAKVSRDRYMKALCKKNPELDKKYGWTKNKAYGTKQHRDGIKTHGITEYHRKSFGICKQYAEPSDDEDNFE